MRITMAITVAGGEGLTLDYARLWRRVWLVVAAWISASCRVKWRGREAEWKRDHKAEQAMDGRRNRIMHTFAFLKDKAHEF